jgi:1-acyl-sn-glycerol-3-phosphate acyltransferase
VKNLSFERGERERAERGETRVRPECSEEEAVPFESGVSGRVDRLRRLAATARCFAAFGAGSLALTLFAFPVSRLLPGDAEVRRNRARRMIGFAIRVFGRIVRALGVLTVEIRGAERLGRPGQLILANHPTLFDGIFLLGLSPSSSCIAKEALARNPFTRGPVAAAGYVSNSPTDRMIEGAAGALRAGQSVIMFPEGTRTVPGETLKFQRGAAAIAVRAASVVTPVYIRCDPPILVKRDRWYRIPARRVRFSLTVGADIDPEPFRGSAPRPAASRAFNAHLLRVFTTEFTRAGETIE